MARSAAENRRRLEVLRRGGKQAEQLQRELAKRNAKRLALSRNGKPSRHKVLESLPW